ncbi:hypothetical protein [Actinophytocola xanthii]|uniref:PspA domain-containing protein n=1 Tax=Actinophytocola xanthii TaxID=1912961 RepID=A0A1Q8CWJ7_9PSEU|nr:hypothetical protein [Actinophytocola xanthii]OLF18739.1 hypothetical protein BU204_04310 [Actinophytocola xanthii]
MTERNEPEPIDAEIVEEPPPAAPETATGYTEGGVPTFDYVRDQIERRAATSTGAEELAAESQQGRTIDQQLAERDKAGRDKLEEIRRAMREGGSSS